MNILFIFLLSIVSQVASKQWIDPHDMNTNSKKYLKKSSSTGDLTRKNEECKVDIQESNYLVYLKRTINLLLNAADISKNEAEYYGRLHFKLDHEDLQFLKNFGTIDEVSMEDLRKMDTILSQSLEKSYMDDFSDMFSSAQGTLYHLIFSQNGLPLLALTFCFPYVLYNLFKSNFSFWFAIRYLLLMVFMIDFIERSQQLRQDAEEHNNQLKYSLKCDTSKMSWKEYFKFMAGNEDCEIKVVSLLEVFLNQVKNVIIVPMSAVGTGMGQFGSELWKNLPFPWNILIFPIMLVFCAIIIAIIMTTMNSAPFKINLMHLLHLEFGDKREGIRGKTLDKLLDAFSHRPLLQEVQSRKERSPPKKIKTNGKEKIAWPKKNDKSKNGKQKEKASSDKENKEEAGTTARKPQADNKSPGNSD